MPWPIIRFMVLVSDGFEEQDGTRKCRLGSTGYARRSGHGGV
jgi:hypothetical protein